jgi:nickel-type superoxide dismutase maturation protease
MTKRKHNVLNNVLKFFLLLSPIYKFKISGSSMAPTIAAGEYVLVNRLAYLFHPPQKGDIVSLRDPRDGKMLIKRILKRKGEMYFVQGDNKVASTDSRVFGWVEKKAIIGKVWFF